jgi:hypothetical protein
MTHANHRFQGEAAPCGHLAKLSGFRIRKFYPAWEEW